MGRGDTLDKRPWKPDEVATVDRVRDDRGRFLPGQKNLSWRYDVKKVPTDDDLALIEQMAADGHGQMGICKAIPIDFKTWQRWLRDYPQVKEAWRAGLAEEEHFLVSKLRELAEKQAVPAIFLLKAKHGYQEGEPPQQDKRVQIAVTLPGPLPASEYRPEVIVNSAKAITTGGDDDG